MLTNLSIKNFAIASHIDIEFQAGMSVMTGETGAGKSILLGALGLTLGDRADSGMVRHGETKAEISAIFDLSNLPDAKRWLEDHDLEQEQECILRRVITAEGRSRAYINGQPCPLSDIKSIGEQLLNIHSQHEHQTLLIKDKHRELLDAYAGHSILQEEVKEHYAAWKQKAEQYELLVNNKEESEARLQVLEFQVDELNQLGIQEGEIELLEQEQSTLANSEQFIQGAHDALEISTQDESGLLALLVRAKNSLSALPEGNAVLTETLGMLEEASIQVEEASNNLRHFMDSFEMDPERLQTVEERLSTSYQLARKHRCQPEELLEVHFRLSEELDQLSGGEQNIESLAEEVSALKQQYLEQAEKLTQSRMEHAQTLENEVAQQLQDMSMENVVFKAALNRLDERALSRHGADDIEFLISTNPGQPARPIAKVASGGELSRISLAIQVVLAQRSSVPSMVFDEVDVGIGGSTAEVVGRLLRKLGEKGQVICVTHQAQVASQGQHHFRISKSLVNDAMHSQIEGLSNEERTEEVARMLGGVKITEQTLAHAREMLGI